MAATVAAEVQAQPLLYPSGLAELPMGPASDVTALHSGRCPLDAFLKRIRAGVTWAIEQRTVFYRERSLLKRNERLSPAQAANERTRSSRSRVRW